jgi:hypothetical protein
MTVKQVFTIEQIKTAHIQSTSAPDGFINKQILFFALDEEGQIHGMTLSEDRKSFISVTLMTGFMNYV